MWLPMWKLLVPDVSRLGESWVFGSAFLAGKPANHTTGMWHRTKVGPNLSDNFEKM